MHRNELLSELTKEGAIGAQLLEDVIPDVEVDAHLYSEVLSRHPTDPSATNATVQLHLLGPEALIICTCEVEAIQSVDVGDKVEIRRGSKRSSTQLLPLRGITVVELSASTGVFQGRSAEPDEPFTLKIRFDHTSDPRELYLPEQRILENRPQQEIRAVHEQVKTFGMKLMARLGGDLSKLTS